MPGLEDIAYGLARGVTKAVCDELVANGPALMAGIVGAYRAAWADTLEDSKVNPAEVAALKKAQADAIAANQLPPRGIL